MWSPKLILLSLLLVASLDITIGNIGKNDAKLILGINGHPLNQAAYLECDLTTQLRLIKKMGLTYYRIDVLTSVDGAAANEDKLIKLVKLAGRYKIKILPIFFLQGFDFNDDLNTSTKKGYILGKGITRRYKTFFNFYELGNEEELKVMDRSSDGSDLSHYNINKARIMAGFLRGMIEGIRENDITAKTIINTAGWLHYGFFSILQSENVNYDILGLHWYSEMGKITDLNLNGKHVNMVDLLTKRYNKPIWITEINRRGGSGVEEYHKESSCLKDYLSELKGQQAVKAFFIYELFDEPNLSDHTEASYGLLYQSTINGKYLFKFDVNQVLKRYTNSK